MVPVFALIAFLAIIFPGLSIYLIPIEGLYESFALCSFFLLMSAYIDEDDEEREAFFVNNGTSGQHRVSPLTVLETRAKITDVMYSALPSVSSNSLS
jgi:hypothetical protein